MTIRKSDPTNEDETTQINEDVSASFDLDEQEQDDRENAAVSEGLNPETDGMDSTYNAENPEASSKALSHEVSGGDLTFNEQVLEKITTLALESVEGVLAASGSGGFFNLKNTSGVDVKIQDNHSVIVNLEVILEYGRSAPEIFKELKQSITASIEKMTGLFVQEVNVRVLNVLTSEEFNGKSTNQNT